MKKRILEICSEVCGREISADEQLIVTKVLDSFKLMELICSLEEEFQFQFLPEEIMELEHFSTAEQIAELVSSKVMTKI